MPKVSVKEFQRRIADLDTEPTFAKPPRQSAVTAGIRRLIALIVLAMIALAALSNAHRTTSGISTASMTTDKATAPRRQMTDAEAQAKWNAMWGALSTGFKRGFVERVEDK